MTGIDDDSIAHFRRDATTGLLSFAEVYVNGSDGITGLDAPLGTAVSPDGAAVYVAAAEARALVVFRRDPATGALTFVEDDVEPTKLYLAFAVAVSPDSEYVYVTGGSGISVYRRDPLSGALTEVQFVDAAPNHDVAITGDGTRAYACGSGAGLAGYARDAGTGFLTLDETAAPGDEGASAPAFCFGMTMVSDGEQFYTIDSYEPAEGVYEYALGVFRRVHARCDGAPRMGCRQTLRPRASSLVLAAGSKARLKWKWRGAAIVQLVGSDGASGTCWEARYSMPAFDQIDTYKAKSD